MIPVRDGEAFLAEAIESALDQTLAPLEVIVIDDGSTDGTVEVASRYGDPVRVLSQSNAGPPAARARGVAEARGELIAFLDADDLWLPGKLEVQAALLRARELDVVLCQAELWVDPGSTGDRRVERWLTAPHVGYVWSTGLFRAESFERYGGPDRDETGGGGAAFGWFAEARENGMRDGAAEQVLARRRLHAGSLSINSPHMDQLLDAIKVRLERSRSAG